MKDGDILSEGEFNWNILNQSNWKSLFPAISLRELSSYFEFWHPNVHHQFILNECGQVWSDAQICNWESIASTLKNYFETLSGSLYWIISNSVWLGPGLSVFNNTCPNSFTRARICFTLVKKVAAHLVFFKTVTATFAFTVSLSIVATLSWRNSENIFEISDRLIKLWWIPCARTFHTDVVC